MKYIRYSGILILCLGLWPCAAQTSLEERLTEGLSETAAEAMIDQLNRLKRRPLDLNTVTPSRLRSLPFLSPMEARRILENRKKHGPFEGWEGLLKRAGLDSTRWTDFIPYLGLGQKRPRSIGLDLRLEAKTRTPRSRGYKEKAYAGDPWRVRQRMKWMPHATVTTDLLVEKDAGETRWADHASAALAWRLPDRQTRIVTGHLAMETGLGWTFWGLYGGYLGSDPITPVLRRGRGLRLAVTSHEGLMLRGLGAEARRGPWQIILVASAQNLDASVDSLGRCTAWDEAGLHRTATERAKVNRAWERLWGGHLEWQRRSLCLGIGGWTAQYRPFKISSDSLRQPFAWQGRTNAVLGLDGEIFLGPVHLAAETARSQSGGLGGQAVLSAGDATLEGLIALYHADPDFHNPHAFALGESAPINRQGVYGGCRLFLARHARLSLHGNLYRHLSRTYTLPAPGWGRRLFAELFTPCKPQLDLRLRAVLTTGEQATTAETPWGAQDGQRLVRRWQFRLELESKLNRNWSGRCRFEGIWLHRPALSGQPSLKADFESGFLAFGELQWRHRQAYRGRIRILGYHTDSYDSRIAVQRLRLPGQYGLAFFQGKGAALEGLVRLPIGKRGQVAFQIWHDLRHDDRGWGSGWDQISNRHRTDLTLSLTWRH